MAPGGNIGKDSAVFEAVHGSAPDIAGKGLANQQQFYYQAYKCLDIWD